MADERERARERECAAAGHHEWAPARGPCELCAITRCEVGDHAWGRSGLVTALGRREPVPLGGEPRLVFLICEDCSQVDRRWGPWDTAADQHARARRAQIAYLRRWTALARNFGGSRG